MGEGQLEHFLVGHPRHAALEHIIVMRNIWRKEDNVARAQQAERIINDPLFKETTEAIRAKLLEEWENSAPGDTVRRENAWQMTVLLRRLIAELEEHMKRGQFADKQLSKVKRAR